MSFDLFFCWHKNEPINFESVSEWSHKHRHFERKNNQLWYSNEVTGVYFSLEFELRDAGESDIPPDYSDAGLYFNLNFNRPRFFAYEAMPVVVDLCCNFGLSAYDPQGEGINETPGVEELIDSWSRSNRNAIAAFQEMSKKDPILRMPESVSRYLWSYSRKKHDLENELGDDVFVPGLFPFRRAGSSTVETMIVCTSGIPMIIPKNQWIVIRRPRRRLFGMKEEIETGVVSATVFDSALEGLITQYPGWNPAVRIIKPENTDAVAKHLKSIQDMLPVSEFERIGLDAFVDLEDGK